MRKAVIGLALPLVLLTACEVKVGKDDAKENGEASVSIGADGNVAISAKDGADGVAVSVPGFKGQVSIPGMELGGDHMDIDGMKLYPGTKLGSINVTEGKGPDNGVVDMRFTSADSPDKLAAYYASAAKDAGFSNIAVKRTGAAASFTATKSDGDLVTIAIDPAAKGSAGSIRVTDGK